MQPEWHGCFEDIPPPLPTPGKHRVCGIKKEVPPSQPSQEDNARSGISVFQEVYTAVGIEKCR